MFHTNFRPDQIHSSVFIAQGAIIVGDVTLEEGSSVWFNAVLRGDTEPITVGRGSNIQDGAILHTDPGDPAIIGQGVTVGHRAIIHGAQIGDNALIGMGATVLNKAVIGEGCLVGANALVTGGKTFEPRSLILGAPAKVVRPLTDEEVAFNHRSAQTYIQRANEFKTGSIFNSHHSPLQTGDKMTEHYLRKANQTNPINEDWGSLNWLASQPIGNAEGLTLGRVVIKKGQSNPRHAHLTCEEALYLLKGRLEHTVGDEAVFLEPGDTLTIPTGIFHNAASIGDEDADMIVVYSSGQRDFVLEE